MEQLCDRNGSTVPLKKENAGEYMTIRMEWLVERFRDSRVYSSKGILSRPKISGLGRPLLRHTEHAQKRLEIGSTSKFAIRRPVRLIQ